MFYNRDKLGARFFLCTVDIIAIVDKGAISDRA